MYDISIHALAKRATHINRNMLANQHISIHALAKRATVIRLNFGIIIFISIHALAKMLFDKQNQNF